MCLRQGNAAPNRSTSQQTSTFGATSRPGARAAPALAPPSRARGSVQRRTLVAVPRRATPPHVTDGSAKACRPWILARSTRQEAWPDAYKPWIVIRIVEALDGFELGQNCGSWLYCG